MRLQAEPTSTPMHAGGVGMQAPPRFVQSPRIRKLAQRSRDLAISGKRRLGSADAPLGDHACWIHIGTFPHLDQMPSTMDGYAATGESWGRDYAFLVDHFPVEIHPDERIVGEIHWEMHMVRPYTWPANVEALGRRCAALGASGYSSGHTCPDLSIGLSQGFGGIRQRIRQSRAAYTELDNQVKASYLHGLEMICESVIRFIQRHAETARERAATETDPWQQDTYRRIAACCEHIATEPPRTYYEGVQWIHFAVMLDRVVGHGNGYGRLDAYLIDLYRRSQTAGDLSAAEAREYLSEMFLKLRGHFFSVGGRDAAGRDATNAMSVVVLEGYDLVGDYNNLGVMWHPDIDPAFYAYACDVLARHGESIPVLVNYDLMHEAQLRSGIPAEDAWKVVYSGCQWFCIPGKEYCDQDVNSYNIILPMQRAIARAVDEEVTDFESLFALFEDEMTVTARALRDWKNAQYELLGALWPEMYTSMMSHGPIERGIDMVDNRGVDYQFTSVNILGIPNVADSLHAIRTLVFEQRRFTLAEVKAATDRDWAGREPMRQRFLNQDKFGNDRDAVDTLLVRITDTLAGILERMINLRGHHFRASLFHFQGHLSPSAVGATPDGRLAEEYLAHGINPQVGRTTEGLLATANSIARIDQRKFQGGPMQIELQPRFFDSKDGVGGYVRAFSETFFAKGGIQINLNIMDLNKLRDAMVHPENPDYQNIIVRVTGYASRFICLPPHYQQEFVERMNHEGF